MGCDIALKVGDVILKPGSLEARYSRYGQGWLRTPSYSSLGTWYSDLGALLKIHQYEGAAAMIRERLFECKHAQIVEEHEEAKLAQ